MKKLFVIISLVGFLLCSSKLSYGQKIVAGVSSQNNESSLLFFDEDLKLNRQLNLGKVVINEIKFFKNEHNNSRQILAKCTKPYTGILVIDIDTNQVVKKLLDGVVVSRIETDNNGHMYALTDIYELFFIDLDNLTVKKLIDLKTLEVRGYSGGFNIAVSKNFVYVAQLTLILKKKGINDKEIVKILRFDKDGKKEVIGKLLFDGRGTASTRIIVSSNDNYVYLPVIEDNKIKEINLVTNASRDIFTDIQFPTKSCLDEKTNILTILSESVNQKYIESINIKTSDRKIFFDDNIIKVEGQLVANNGFVIVNINQGGALGLDAILAQIDLTTGETKTNVYGTSVSAAGVVIIE